MTKTQNQIKYDKKKYRNFVNKRYSEMKNPNFYKIQSKVFLETSNNELLKEILKPFGLKKINNEEACRYYLMKNHLNDISKPIIKNISLSFFILKFYYFIELKFRELFLLKISKKIIKEV